MSDIDARFQRRSRLNHTHRLTDACRLHHWLSVVSWRLFFVWLTVHRRYESSARSWHLRHMIHRWRLRHTLWVIQCRLGLRKSRQSWVVALSYRSHSLWSHVTTPCCWICYNFRTVVYHISLDWIVTPHLSNIIVLYGSLSTDSNGIISPDNWGFLKSFWHSSSTSPDIWINRDVFVELAVIDAIAGGPVFRQQVRAAIVSIYSTISNSLQAPMILHRAVVCLDLSPTRCDLFGSKKVFSLDPISCLAHRTAGSCSNVHIDNRPFCPVCFHFWLFKLFVFI